MNYELASSSHKFAVLGFIGLALEKIFVNLSKASMISLKTHGWGEMKTFAVLGFF